MDGQDVRELVLACDLVDDEAAAAEYERFHSPGGVPDAVLQSIVDADVRNMRIFRAGTRRLIMIMSVGPGFDADQKAQADASNPDVVAWERRMDPFQVRVPGSDAKWCLARQIFDLEQHAMQLSGQ